MKPKFTNPIFQNSHLSNPDFVKYPKIPYLETCLDIIGHQGYTFEKVDGSLSQVRMTEESVLLGGSKANYMTGKNQRPFWSRNFLKWMRSNNSLLNLPPGVILYGEWLEPVTVQYNSDSLNKFYFIDLALAGEDRRPIFFDYVESVDYLKKWKINGVEILPPLDVGIFTEARLCEIVETGKSRLGPELEGVVIKNYRLGKFVKLLSPHASEIRHQEQTLDEQYLTEVRVKKSIRRLQDRGIRIPSLEDVVLEVVIDISEETGIEFDLDAVRGVIRVKDYYPFNHYRQFG